jgi:Transcriptional regulator containing an amidase domain and an AraC-type DNA-binding HTH domain
MKDFELIKNLVGKSITETDLKNVDCYVQKNLGLFIPSMGACGYALRENHIHPSYMVVIYFSDNNTKSNHYPAVILSPDIPHNDETESHYYCLMIDKAYFESQYRLYDEVLPLFSQKNFEMCSDILKTMNIFAFEYKKSMMNSDITLEAQATVITHWIIRSILGETLDMRAVSSDYSVARAQHYIEQHFAEKIAVSDLSKLGYMSVSSLNRKFKSEIGKTPIEYLIQVRIERAKTLLRRKDIPMTDIALRCGFSSSAYFSACFVRHINMTPSEYQSRYIE